MSATHPKLTLHVRCLEPSPPTPPWCNTPHPSPTPTSAFEGHALTSGLGSRQPCYIGGWALCQSPGLTRRDMDPEPTAFAYLASWRAHTHWSRTCTLWYSIKSTSWGRNMRAAASPLAGRSLSVLSVLNSPEHDQQCLAQTPPNVNRP
jgi:hypothetical protein